MAFAAECRRSRTKIQESKADGINFKIQEEYRTGANLNLNQITLKYLGENNKWWMQPCKIDKYQKNRVEKKEFSGKF
ncbi:hypothetical protein V6Z11_A12G132600 [Gossypium hirsutum]